jgi:hypothetical protein
MIPLLLEAAFGDADGTSPAAAAVIDAAFAHTPVRALSRLEDECRRVGWYLNAAWYSLRPVELSRFDPASPARLGLAGVASFHHDGYVREAAVAWLATLDARALPFLLLRLNDWVPQIAERALLAVQSRLVGTQADALIDCLPLVASLERSTRRDHHTVIEAVYAVLRDPAQREALARGRRSTDRLIRRLCFRLARQSAGSAILDLFRESRDDPDAALRLAAITDTVARVRVRELEAVMVAASTDPFPPVRRVALDAVATHLDATLAQPLLERGLLDPGRSVRDVARYHLARLQLPVDVTQSYVDSLAGPLQPRTLATALAGLRETGRPEHAGIALGFLDHDRPIVRRAALRTVAALNATGHLDRLVALLDDPSPTVAKTAAEALQPHVGTIGIDAILGAVRSAQRSHNRVAAASLALGLGKWNRLLALLDVMNHPDIRLRERVGCWLLDWLDRQNRAYAQPTPAQIDAITRALAENSSRIEVRTREEIEHALAYWSPK